MHTLKLRRANLIAFVLSLGFLWPATAQAQDTGALNSDLDKTIRSACHSYLVDALPDSLSWLKSEIYERSPFCTKALEAIDKEELNDAIQETYAERPLDGRKLDFSKKFDRDLNITIECQSEYMCMETRLKFLGTKHPIDQEAYSVVREYCLERYGCIEAYFADWPKALPSPKKPVESQIVTFESVLGLSSAAEISAFLADQPAPDAQNFAKAEESTGGAPQTQETNRQIEKLCACSLAGRSCFDNPYGPVRKYISRIDAERQKSCKAWQKRFTPLSTAGLSGDALRTALSSKQDELRAIDARGEEIIALAAADFERIKARVQNKQPFVPTLERDKIEALARGESANSPNVASAPQAGASQQAAAANQIVLGPNLSWDEAGKYCKNLGLRLPNIGEARARLAELRSQDAYLGIWTAEPRYIGPSVRKYQTLRDNGFTEGENASSVQRVACFK